MKRSQALGLTRAEAPLAASPLAVLEIHDTFSQKEKHKSGRVHMQ